MVSWNEIHGHVTQRFQALFLLVCSCKTFLPSDDTVLVKMHHHDTIFKKMHQGTTPRVTWCVKFGSCAHRCEMPRAFCGGACHRERWWSLARVCNKCKCPQREEGGHVVEKAGVTMGSTGSRNLWPRKGSRACGMCRARVSGFQEDLGICLQVLESASQREVTGKEWLKRHCIGSRRMLSHKLIERFLTTGRIYKTRQHAN